MKTLFRFLAVLVVVFCCAGAAFGQDDLPAKTWIFFADKLDKMGKTTMVEAGYVSTRARHRRMLRASTSRPLHDAPVSAAYLEQLRVIGITPIRTSRWLNAISARIPEGQLKTVRGLPFVRALQPLRGITPPPLPDHAAEPILRSNARQPHKTMDLDFGPSHGQVNLINAIDAINRGIIGEGVVIGFLDTRFDISSEEYFDHEVFDHLDEDQIEVTDYTTDMGSAQNNWHGVSTSSVAIGFKEGELIGPAYGVEKVYGAITEYAPFEENQEEDAFVEGLEWMESEGVDLVSASLGYSTFDPGQESYNTEDMDGDTAITTVACDLAAEKGVVVVVSAGNLGLSSWGIISSPADGDSVIAVGGTSSSGTRVGFSSTGPTADGRIKPDVMAQGQTVRIASANSTSSYSTSSGTSLSAPIVAGVAAQLLQAEPRLTPFLVREILRDTADRADEPDNYYGWGIIDAEAAIGIAEACADPQGECDYSVSVETASELPQAFDAKPPYPNPFRDEVSFDVRVPRSAASVKISLYNLLGQRVGVAFDGPMHAGEHTVTYKNAKLPAGLYLYSIEHGDARVTGKVLLVR